jgi:hypothetical protein
MTASLKERFRQVDRIPTPWDRPGRVPEPPEARPATSRRGAFVAAVSAAAVAVAVAIVVASPGDEPSRGRPPVDISWLTETNASCVELYSPQSLAGRSWAFEGVVTSVEPPVDPHGEDPATSTTTVTLDVVRWFWGGSEQQVALRTYAAPSSAGQAQASLGARLLLAGEEDFLWQCGFTGPATERRTAEFEAASAARAAS